ncbi:MAG: LysM peptidoglycan-binding domain-containing protein [Verrucomicrobiota bacterium]
MRLTQLFPRKPSRPAASAARQRLQAAVARRGVRAPSIEEDEEPTTSFKTALIVVVLLHLIAAAGVYMFDSIKTHRPAPPVSKKTAAAPALAAPPAVPAAAAQRAKPQPAPAATTEPVKKTATAAPVAAEVKDSGALYTVAKGETPVAIAKKLHVAYDDLLKLNKIDDPKKLRIGQKLHVPVKPRALAN